MFSMFLLPFLHTHFSHSFFQITLFDLMHHFGDDTTDTIDILKIDIENWEFRVLNAYFGDKRAPKICQLLIEMHGDQGDDKLWAWMFEKIERHGFLLFYKEQNTLCPHCTEFAYIHETCSDDY